MFGTFNSNIYVIFFLSEPSNSTSHIRPGLSDRYTNAMTHSPKSVSAKSSHSFSNAGVSLFKDKY